jgi:hypothetical protein
MMSFVTTASTATRGRMWGRVRYRMLLIRRPLALRLCSRLWRVYL